jgi:hypothetical protein
LAEKPGGDWRPRGGLELEADDGAEGDGFSFFFGFALLNLF